MSVDVIIHVFGCVGMAVSGWMTGCSIVRTRRCKRTLRAFREENRLFEEGWQRIGNARSRDEMCQFLLDLAEAIQDHRQRTG